MPTPNKNANLMMFLLPQAVVEYVSSGHRLKLHIPKEGVSIAFAPSGVRTPQRAQPANNGRPAHKVRRGAQHCCTLSVEPLIH